MKAIGWRVVQTFWTRMLRNRNVGLYQNGGNATAERAVESTRAGIASVHERDLEYLYHQPAQKNAFVTYARPAIAASKQPSSAVYKGLQVSSPVLKTPSESLADLRPSENSLWQSQVLNASRTSLPSNQLSVKSSLQYRCYHTSSRSEQSVVMIQKMHKTLPTNLKKHEIIHILKFLHAVPGTSVFFTLATGNPCDHSDDEIIFAKMYNNKRIPVEDKNLHHAERQLCEDVDSIIEYLKSKHLITKHIKVRIFQNNSPCTLCSRDLSNFKNKLSSVLHSTGCSFQFEIQVQHLYEIHLKETQEELQQLYRSGVKLTSLEWHQFYDALSKWILQHPGRDSSEKSLATFQDQLLSQTRRNVLSLGNTTDATLTTADDIICHLYETCLQWLVKFKQRQTEEAKQDIDKYIKTAGVIRDFYEASSKLSVMTTNPEIEKRNVDSHKECVQNILQSRETVFIYRLPEDSHLNDEQLVDEVLESIQVEEKPVAIRRRGKKNVGDPSHCRPIEVVFFSAKAKQKALQQAKMVRKAKNVAFNPGTIVISPHESKLQRQEKIKSNQLRAERKNIQTDSSHHEGKVARKTSSKSRRQKQKMAKTCKDLK